MQYSPHVYAYNHAVFHYQFFVDNTFVYAYPELKQAHPALLVPQTFPNYVDKQQMLPSLSRSS